jgi:hypothetical protein
VKDSSLLLPSKALLLSTATSNGGFSGDEGAEVAFISSSPSLPSSSSSNRIEGSMSCRKRRRDIRVKSSIDEQKHRQDRLLPFLQLLLSDPIPARQELRHGAECDPIATARDELSLTTVETREGNAIKEKKEGARPKPVPDGVREIIDQEAA